MSENLPSQPWGGLEPRRWQREALPLALAAIKSRERGVVSAIMGAGKSRLQAEICASGRGRVLVTVPTVTLVEQMAATIAERCPGEVGMYYTHRKEAGERVTVCCLPSLPQLLADPGWTGPLALWVCDEAHRSQCSTVLDVYNDLAPDRAIAFTATPFRSNEGEELSLWQREVYRYGAQAAIADGVVVPWRVECWTGADMTPIDEACTAMIRQFASGPGLVNALHIADAEAYAECLVSQGVSAAAVHSRMKRQDVLATIDALKAGRLDTIVHVNMLSEGVDMPWLRWLCLRRPVKARVRFVQEVGRVLRAAPGKTEAVILDPHDLMQKFGLSYEAMLEGSADDDEPAEIKEKEVDDALTEIERQRHNPPARAIRTLERYLRQYSYAAQLAGLVQIRVAAGKWRQSLASEKQLQQVHRAVTGLGRDTTVPIEHRRVLLRIPEIAESFMRGTVSDFLTVSFALRDARRNGVNIWPLLSVPEAEAEALPW